MVWRMLHCTTAIIRVERLTSMNPDAAEGFYFCFGPGREMPARRTRRLPLVRQILSRCQPRFRALTDSGNDRTQLADRTIFRHDWVNRERYVTSPSLSITVGEDP